MEVPAVGYQAAAGLTEPERTAAPLGLLAVAEDGLAPDTVKRRRG
jgi:hypothetical protein